MYYQVISKEKSFFQACPDPRLGGKEGEFGGEEIVLPSFNLRLLKIKIYRAYQKEITKESFEFICQLKLKPKQIPLQIIASLKSVNTINSCESHSNQRLKLVDLSKLGNCDTNKRSVKVGCDADFIMLEPDTLQLVSTWVAGVKVFPKFQQQELPNFVLQFPSGRFSWVCQ